MNRNMTRTKSDIERLTSKWQSLMEMGWVEIKHSFVEMRKEDEETVVADTEAYWQYRYAKVTWYLGHCVSLDDDALESAVVHELVHVLNNPMESHVADRYNDECEFATESLTRAILAVRDGI